MCSIAELNDKLDKTVNHVMYIKFYCDKCEMKKIDMIFDEDILKYLYLATENIYSIAWEIIKHNRKGLYNEKPKELISFFADAYILSDKSIEKTMYIDLCYRDLLKNGVKSCFYRIGTVKKLTEYYDDILDELYEYLDY